MIAWVASLAEAWIEISDTTSLHLQTGVASLAEAWIEIGASATTDVNGTSRLPRGGVD